MPPLPHASALDDAGVVRSVSIIPVAVPLLRPMLWSGGRDEHAVQLLVELTTDTGLTGVGECMAALDADVVQAAARHFGRMLVGRTVSDLAGLPPSSHTRGRWGFFLPLAHYALSGLDIAIWDIAGKAANVPVHRFFGASANTTVDHFFWIHRGGTQDDLLAQARHGLASGHDTFYVKVGLDETALEVIDTVTKLREVLGPIPKLRVDANQAWRSADALTILTALEACDLDWIEEPVADASASDLRRLREDVGVRVAVDQGAWLSETMIDLARAGAIDVVCTDASRLGGLGEFVRVAATLRPFDVEICRHCANEFGVFLAASLHACAATTNLAAGNQYCDQLSWDIINEDMRETAGQFRVPSGPGLGVTIDESAVAAAREYYEQVVAGEMPQTDQRIGNRSADG